MKKFRFLFAAMLLLSFAACTEKEEDPSGNTNTGNGGGGDAEVSFTIGNPTWEQEGMIYYATYEWTATLSSTSLKLSSFYDESEGKSYSFGIGYAPEGVEGGQPRYFNGDKPENTHEIISVNDDSTVFTFRSRVKADNRKEARAFVYLNDNQFHYSSLFYMDPAEAPQTDLGVAMPEQVMSTPTTLTVESHFTGNITGPEQFQNASCGFVWCPESEGAPTIGDNNTIDCTQSAWQNNGSRFEGTITGLTEGGRYNVAAWLRLSPDSEPILSDWHTMAPQGGGGDDDQNDTNWINLENVSMRDATTMSVEVTAFLSGEPAGIGAVYNTTGNPTLDDQVYNALEHFNFQTGQYDETIEYMSENPDGSRAVRVLISGLQPNTTYYVRGYMQFSDGTPTIYTSEMVVTPVN